MPSERDRIINYYIRNEKIANYSALVCFGKAETSDPGCDCLPRPLFENVQTGNPEGEDCSHQSLHQTEGVPLLLGGNRPLFRVAQKGGKKVVFEKPSGDNTRVKDFISQALQAGWGVEYPLDFSLYSWTRFKAEFLRRVHALGSER